MANSEEIDDGGPAFARPGFFHSDGRSEYDNRPEDGMSLRDWIAGQALPAVASMIVDISNSEFLSMAKTRGLEGDKTRLANLAALMSYEIADAMIACRKGGGA